MRPLRVMSSLCSPPRHQAGASAVEFAIVLVPLLLIVFGITEFGRAIYQYNTLTKSARAASRYLAADDYRDSKRLDEAMCLAVYARKVCTGAPVIAGLDTTNVDVEFPQLPASAATLNVVTVTIEGFKFNSLVPWGVASITFGPIRASMPVLPL
jgi:Flp pilus assembly protein TadG